MSVPSAASWARPAAAPPVRSLDRRVLGLAIPAIAENLLQTSLIVMDTVMIKQADPTSPIPLAAAALAGSLMWRGQMTVGCVEKGTSALAARAIGAGDPERAARAVGQSLVLAVAAGLALTVVGVGLAPWLMRAVGASPEVAAAGVPFLRVVMAASVARMLFGVAAAGLRAAGDTRTPMWITLAMNAVNLAGNYALIGGHWGFPRMGLTGSAVATALGIVAAAAAALAAVAAGRGGFRVAPRHLRPDRATMAALLRVAAPSFAEEVIVSVGFLGATAAIASLGTAAVAAHTVAMRVEALSYMGGFGFAVAAATMVGQSLGAGDVAGARAALRRCVWYCVGLMSAVAVGLILGGHHVVDWFSPEDGATPALAGTLLLICALEQPLMAHFMTIGGGLRGAGDTLTPMAVSLWGNVIVRLALCHLALARGWGIEGIYWLVVADWLTRCLAIQWAFASGRWARVRV